MQVPVLQEENDGIMHIVAALQLRLSSARLGDCHPAKASFAVLADHMAQNAPPAREGWVCRCGCSRRRMMASCI